MKYPRKSNGKSFSLLENKVAPMVVKLAESLERTMGSQMGDGGGDNKQAMLKIAKQIKKSREDAAREERDAAKK